MDNTTAAELLTGAHAIIDSLVEDLAVSFIDVPYKGSKRILWLREFANKAPERRKRINTDLDAALSIYWAVTLEFESSVRIIAKTLGRRYRLTWDEAYAKAIDAVFELATRFIPRPGGVGFKWASVHWGKQKFHNSLMYKRDPDTVDLETAQVADTVPAETDLDNDLLWREREQLLDAYLATLTPRQRELLEAYASGLSYHEVAKQYRCGFTTLKKLVDNAKKAMRIQDA